MRAPDDRSGRRSAKRERLFEGSAPLVVLAQSKGQGALVQRQDAPRFAVVVGALGQLARRGQGLGGRRIGHGTSPARHGTRGRSCRE